MSLSSACKYVVGAALLYIAALSVAFAELSQGASKHMGVASCASSVCHGRALPDSKSNVTRNEYRIWLQKDRHSQAFLTLYSPESREMARRMGIDDAHEAQECLSCHAETAPLKGPKFQQSDGVGCEACHGASENWLADHYGPKANLEKSIGLGLTPLHKPAIMGQVCADCHIGDKDRLADHAMMAAGHPRLRFDLDTWLANMPPHHAVDADYAERKGAWSGADYWVAGILASAKSGLELLVSDRFSTRSMLPELSLFDCHGCHRDIKLESLTKGKPGLLHVRDNALIFLPLLAEKRKNSLKTPLETLIGDLGKAESVANIKALATQLQPLVASLQKSYQTALLPHERKALSVAIVQLAGAGAYKDYADAEQAALALEVLTLSYDRNAPTAVFDEIFRVLQQDGDFSARAFARAARKLKP